MCLRLREQCLLSEITSVARVAHVLLHGREYAGVQAFTVDRKHSDFSKALRNPQRVDLCVFAPFS